jgi:molybdopterin molybdotransferase
VVALPLARKIASAIGRTDYVRVAIERGRAVPLATSGASILSSTVRAAGAVVIPREREGAAEGDVVEVLLYDDEPPDASADRKDSVKGAPRAPSATAERAE